ncbi:carbohydrate kinase [Salmonella enterica subsp. diarizonae]|uniref:Carbohydrate kinase n=2 Tax=Salmonella enterica TaxID=28901 RepID=A0A2I5HMK6_SALDZ|nr:FGGY-family carbohydrate kinase [Salmonella enterica]ECU8747403.1 carbohydrate kinase [Salmonella enterica subsp. diarizonae str. CFSAN000558]EGE5260720.1 carbohydrate kinase [Salmonella enterica subsp. diarizonae serovar 38:k:z]EHQ9196238.1 carbohydrate kinase [Salmonella enterica subsp. diarizonae serovar 50:k:z:[z50],[z57],[z68], [z86]]HAE8382142.1 carbohydrate kinase [Salmonella enterica subsp. diarizonae serovar 50:k:z]ANA23000.1 xylulose kinase [Salmonella enterica subsp. diarizonae]
MSRKETFWLGIDCGGTYLKAGLYDAEGHEHGIHRQSLQTLSPFPGYAERDMHQLWQQCVATIAGLLKQTGVSGGQIKGIGISAQGKGLFLLDKQNRPLGNAILSSDRRALNIVERWQQDGIPQKLYPVTRQTLWTGHPASLLRWIKEHEPQRYAHIGCVMMAHDYLRWRLTDVKGCEESNISESNLYNMTTGRYDSRLTQWLGISEIDHALPPVVGSAETGGKISEEAAAITGLAAGTPMVGGLFDVVSTALCAGIDDEFTLNAVMGTWAVTSGIARGLREHEAHPYVYGRYVNDGQYIVHEASPTSSGNLEWFTAQWGDLSFDEINRAVASLPKAGSDLFFLPFLYGSNAGLEMTSGFYGMQALHTRAHLLQALYEGVVFSHMTHLNRMRERFTEVRTLRVTGGPAHSDVWMQMLADVSGLRIELPQVEETGCFGAALAARVGTGVYRSFSEAQRALEHPIRTLLPDMTAHARYQRKYHHYQHLIEALQGYHARIKEHA